jgi:RNA polymerase sigma factor (sigma-70 family)
MAAVSLERSSGGPDNSDNDEGDLSGWGAAALAFRAWRGGDPAGLECLVRLLTPTLWQLARSYGLSRPAAEDAVQTTWLNFVRKADTVREPRAVWGWLTVAVRREAWRLARADGKASVVEPAVLTLISGDGAGSAQSPEAAVVADETALHLWRHVSMLPPRCRRLLRVIAFDERPDYGRLATELDMPIGSIGPTRGRCLKKLRQLMAGNLQRSDR